ncbi:hypothetical protein FEM48_Zijuj07G0048100 [Ziziphus jujuba var. spinosa]|uniref:Glycosyltransferase n=1 Tax=Ziziphus jujuba var. spinosa TaxID=714518 RepID=A0A978V2J4_ZIZJJ|nr:hypothetical protein FEM48_Zijuj07G0048100 [Ziziphus jujuba var. spinosa]
MLRNRKGFGREDAMEVLVNPPRFIVLTYPAQGHLDPALQFSKNLSAVGADVTFFTSKSAYRRINKIYFPAGSSFFPFSNSYDDGFKPGDDIDHYIFEIDRFGSQALSDLIVTGENEGRPFSCVVYTLILPWAGKSESSSLVELPGLSLKLTGPDLPSLMDSTNTYTFAMPIFKELFEMLDKEGNPKVLVNTFDDLEPEALKADYNYIEWLSLKPKGSVFYVSIGSPSVLLKPQMEEIGRALLDTKHPFSWVIRENENNIAEEEDELSCKEGPEELGMIVPWCSQMEVLNNASLGCFLTHCGWNSTLESLVCGVPMVGFPRWSDQGTNAKLVMETWKSGVRVRVRVRANNEGIVEGDEIKRCLELVMGNGEKGKEIRRNAKQWKDLGRQAAMEGGSSHKNLKTFMDEIIMDKN